MYNILEELNKVVDKHVNKDSILESYVYEYATSSNGNSQNIINLGKVYLTDKEIIKAFFNYDEEKIMRKIYLKRYLIKDKNIKLKFTYSMDLMGDIELIDFKSFNNLDLPNYDLCSYRDNYKDFQIKLYELYLENY